MRKDYFKMNGAIRRRKIPPDRERNKGVCLPRHQIRTSSAAVHLDMEPRMTC